MIYSSGFTSSRRPCQCQNILSKKERNEIGFGNIEKRELWIESEEEEVVMVDNGVVTI